MKKPGFWVCRRKSCFPHREVSKILSSSGICVIDFIASFAIRLWTVVVGCISSKNRKPLGSSKPEVKKLSVTFVKVKLSGLAIILSNEVPISTLTILIFGFCSNIWEAVARVLLWLSVNKVNPRFCSWGKVCVSGIIPKSGRFGKTKFLNYINHFRISENTYSGLHAQTYSFKEYFWKNNLIFKVLSKLRFNFDILFIVSGEANANLLFIKNSW